MLSLMLGLALACSMVASEPPSVAAGDSAAAPASIPTGDPAAPAVAGLTMTTWKNGAAGGNGTVSTVTGLDSTTLSFASAADVFSVEIRGTFTPPLAQVSAGKRIELSCEITNGNGYIWLDDHVICEGGHDPAQWGKYQSDAKVLPWMVAPRQPLGVLGGPLFLRATFAHPTPNTGPPPTIILKWVALPAPPPSPPPGPPPPPPTYVGCFMDNGKQRDLAYNAGDLKTTQNPDGPLACAAECRAQGHALKYIGLQDGTNCFCSDTMGSQGKAKTDSECNMACPGKNKGTKCGGADRNSIYLTHNPPSPPPPPTPPAHPIPSSSFTTAVPHFQQKRLDMQRGLLHGRWGSFAKGSYAAHALLPHGILIKFGVCDADGGCTKDATKGAQTSDLVRVGAHAYDHSYTQLYMNSSKHCNISLETSQVGGVADADLIALVTPISGCEGASALAVMLMTTNLTEECAAWLRYGNVVKTAAGGMSATPAGTGLAPVDCSAAGATFSGKANPEVPTDSEYLLRALTAPVAFSTGKARTVAEVSAIIAAARTKELATYAKYGDLADAKQMSQVGMMWNVLYSLEIPGTFAPVSRGWGQPWVVSQPALSAPARTPAHSMLRAL